MFLVLYMSYVEFTASATMTGNLRRVAFRRCLTETRNICENVGNLSLVNCVVQLSGGILRLRIEMSDTENIIKYDLRFSRR